jgi:AcrR family transcriptional regulator
MSHSRSTQSERIKNASRKRREQKKQETRQAIIDAASALFLEHGYENFSLRQVAEQIGYSPGTIYLYFSDKDELLFTLADIGFQRFGEALQAAVDATDNPREQINGLGRAYIAFGLENPVHYRLMFIERTDFMFRDSPEHGKSWIETFYILQHTIERAMASGDIPSGDAEAVSDAVWAAVHGVVAIAIRMRFIPKERIEKATEVLLSTLTHGIYAPPDA